MKYSNSTLFNQPITNLTITEESYLDLLSIYNLVEQGIIPEPEYIRINLILSTKDHHQKFDYVPIDGFYIYYNNKTNRLELVDYYLDKFLCDNQDNPILKVLK